MSVYVHTNMYELGNGEILKLRGNYTGQRLRSLRPETYREVVRLLAEPREHVSIREICRRCHVTDDTVKAIERREAVPIATRKQELMVQAARIAKRAYDRVEDEIDEAPLSQAVVTAGVFTDKIVALSNDPIQINQSISIGPNPRLWEKFNALHDELTRKALQARREEESSATQTTPDLPLPAGKTLPESSNES
jgi:hypothetical protein